MKKIFTIMLFVSFGFITKSYAQHDENSQKQINQAKQEVEWVEEIVPLNNAQSELLNDLFLRKNEILSDGVRIEWKKELIFSEMESVLRFGHLLQPQQEVAKTRSSTEFISQEEFDELIRNNDKLLELLNLNLIKD